MSKPVMQVLNAVDDHLQVMQHYAHSHDLREAMSTVQDVLEALLELLAYADGLHRMDNDGVDYVTFPNARAAIARATGEDA